MLQGWTALLVRPAEPTVPRGAGAEPVARTFGQEGWTLVPTELTVGMRLRTEPTVGAVCRPMTALSTQPTAAEQMGRTLRATVVTAQQGRTARATAVTAIQ
jgi:hypothetical protein